MPIENERSAVAALALAESLLIFLREKKIMSEIESDEVLKDAISALKQEGEISDDKRNRGEAIAILRRMFVGTSGIRDSNTPDDASK